MGRAGIDLRCPFLSTPALSQGLFEYPHFFRRMSFQIVGSVVKVGTGVSQDQGAHVVWIGRGEDKSRATSGANHKQRGPLHAGSSNHRFEILDTILPGRMLLVRNGV